MLCVYDLLVSYRQKTSLVIEHLGMHKKDKELTSSVMGVLASTLRRSSSISSSIGLMFAASASSSSCVDID